MEKKMGIRIAARIVLFAGFFAGLGWYAAERSRSAGRLAAGDVLVAIQDVLQVAVTEVRLSQVFEAKKDRLRVLDFPIPTTDQSSLVIASGKALIGYDLEKVVLDKVSDRHYRLRLPAPSLLSTDLQYRFVHEKDGWLNRISPEDRNETLAAIRRQVETELGASVDQTPAAKRAREGISRLAALADLKIDLAP